uniref:Apple domain-containing protein n=2 Tax=Caenorhabditis tropicalis TaxID=1561998 RepID=A0A1I7TYY2_9PELO
MMALWLKRGEAKMKRLLLLAIVLHLSIAQKEVRNLTERAISEADQGEDKFKIYVGTIDGVRRELFNEVDGGQIEVAPDNTPNEQDPFGAYDDNNVVSADNEKLLFVPKPYRPGVRTTRPVPVTTIRTIPFVQTTPATFVTLPPAPVTTSRPSIQSFISQTVVTIPPFVRPPAPTAPPRVVAPQQPEPIRPIQPFQPQQPQSLQPRPQPQTIQPRPPQPQTFQPRPQPVFTPAPFTQPPFRPQPTFATRQPQPQTTPAPRFPPQSGQNLRSGQCPASIFYISTPISGPSRLTFTHFAVAVTVDQCARTCHEFNCAIAHYNPLNGHCEFNPSTAFAIRNGQCPAWPSLHYRNNVVANEPVRIFCVTCQRPRRRPAGRRPFRGQARRGQRLGRKTPVHVPAHTPNENQSTSAKPRQLRATETQQNAELSTERSSQLNLLRQLEDLQL